MNHATRLIIGISVFWLALGILFDGITDVMLPTQLLLVSSSKATILGLLTFSGLIVGMLIQPFAGLSSDRARSRSGRRGPLAIGVILTLVALGYYSFAASLLAISLGYLAVQAAASAAQGVQQGFIPDLIPTARRGVASGFKGFMDVGGASLGFLALGLLLKGGSAQPGILFVALMVIATFLMTIGLVREPTYPQAGVAGRVGLLDAFRLDLRKHRAFVVLVVSRFLFLLGTYAIGHFLLLFVAYRFNLTAGNAAVMAGGILSALSLLTVVASPPMGWAADRFGRVTLMLLGATLSALGAIILAFAQGTLQLIVFGTLLAVGSAAFAGANWALTADLVPQTEPARFFALANFAKAGSAAIAGLLGPLIDLFNGMTSGAGYEFLFVFATLMFVFSGLSLEMMKLGKDGISW